MLHAVAGSNAAGSLQALVAAGRLTGTVLDWPDELSNGPLTDADQVDPQLRTAHWLRLLQAYPLAGADWDEAWQRARAAACRALLQAWEQGTPLTVWVGNHAGEVLLLCMLAAQCPATSELWVVDVSQHLDTPRPGLWSVGLYGPADLAALSGRARRLAAGERQALAAEWTRWQDAGDGVREVHDGALQGRPLSCYDSVLLEVLARHGSVSAARLVGEAMGGIGHAFVGDVLLFWRLQVLAGRGALRLVGAGRACRVEAIRP